MSRVLITGVAGFAGSHLADALLRDPTIFVVGNHHPEHRPQHIIEHERFELHRIDILKTEELESLIREAQPDAVYHLAGLAHVQESWKNRRATIETNFLGTFHLLEACRKLENPPKVLLVGSGECYGNVPEREQPITEARPLLPASPYAVSKIAQEVLGKQYAIADGLQVYLSRPFNHTGERQKETFVCSAFAMQIARGELGLSEPEIRVGNLTARRDFSDVRDVVAAYAAILKAGRPGEVYNICSGKAVSIEDVLNTLLSHSKTEFRIIPDPDRFRPVDTPLLLGSSQKLQQETGWKPQYDLNATLQSLLNYWREKLKSE